MKPRILVVDDEKGMRDFLNILLDKEGYEVRLAGSGLKAKEILSKDLFDLIISDIKMPDISGIELLEYVKEVSPDTIAILITAFASTQTAIAALKLGACDYITKPFDVDEVKFTIRNAIEKKRLVQENIYLRQKLSEGNKFANIIGTSPGMKAVFEMISKVLETNSTVLIAGESGTGKELVARAVHFESRRKGKRFVSINCAAMPESLLESELFGHVRGSFTGAVSNKKGLFEVADEGSLLLDEIEDMSPNMQVKLLRVLQERTIRRVGDTKQIAVDVRIIAATNQDLNECVANGTFREDLFYRINVIQIRIPPLRERPEDIPLLLDHFIKQYAAEMNKDIRGVTKEAIERMLEHQWPGNVREMENAVEMAIALEGSDMIQLENLPESVTGLKPVSAGTKFFIPEKGINLEEKLDRLRKEYLMEALRKARGKQVEAAQLLGLSFRSFRYYLKKYGVKFNKEQ
ncbi:sigma-54-dependent transcriptional regulator [Acidobacteriota bacterium]